MRKSVQGSLSRSLISELWLRRGVRKEEERERWVGVEGGERKSEKIQKINCFQFNIHG